MIAEGKSLKQTTNLLLELHWQVRRFYFSQKILKKSNNRHDVKRCRLNFAGIINGLSNATNVANCHASTNTVEKKAAAYMKHKAILWLISVISKILMLLSPLHAHRQCYPAKALSHRGPFEIFTYHRCFQLQVTTRSCYILFFFRVRYSIEKKRFDVKGAILHICQTVKLCLY